MRDPVFRRLEVRAANIDDIAVKRIPQELSAGEWADERHLGGRGDGLTGLRGWRSDRTEKSKDPVFLYRFGGGFDGFLGLVAVIDRFELKLASIDAAGAIDFLERGENSFAHALAERLRWPVERSDLAKQDLIFEYAVLRPERRN